MEGVRLRLLFNDPDILSESQKSEGLRRSWVVLKPQHRTISDLSFYILNTFQLHDSCPNGLFLSMNGFAFPPFESTCILKDDDIIRVKRKRGTLAVEEIDGPDVVENLQIVEKQPVIGGPFLLANEEYDNETGGYESEEPVDEYEKEEEADPVEDTPHLENALGDNAISKKRKASGKLHSSKKKKHCSGSAKKLDKRTKKQKDLTMKKSHHKQRNVSDPNNNENNKESSESTEDNVSTPSMKKNAELQENGVENVEETSMPDETVKKGRSRNAKRKSKRRRELRELDKIKMNNAVAESEGLRNWKELQAKRGREEPKCPPEGRVSDGGDDQPKGRRNWKQQKSEAKKEQVIGQPKLHWKQLHGEDKHSNTNKQEEAEEKRNLCGKSSRNSDVEDEVVPVVIRPGHIRFEPLEKEQASKQSQVEVESFRWNGITSKKKGQKWGQEKVSFSHKTDFLDSNEDQEMENVEKEAHFHESIDFNTLPFFSGLPREGLVIAYRLLELSFDWTPEVSSYRVGKISWCNSEATKVLLVPVVEFPIVSREDDSSMQTDSSIYKEDGSLEIDFSSLLDVRVVKNDTSDQAAELPDRISDGPAPNESTPVLRTGNKKTDAVAAEAGGVNDGKQTESTCLENGVNLWEQFSETLKAKKAELSHESSGDKGSYKKSSSYRSLRGSALGPTMAFLRSQNEL